MVALRLCSTKELRPEAPTTNCKIIFFVMTYESIVSIWNSLLNSVVDACTVNAFKARDKFWHHQLVKFDFTADLTGTGNRSEEL